MAKIPGNGGSNSGNANSDLSPQEERRVYLKAVVEQINQIHAKGRLEEFLERCNQIGVAPKTVRRWLNAPDAAPQVAKLDLVASALKELGFPVDPLLYRERAADARRRIREAAARAAEAKVEKTLKDQVLLQHNTAKVAVLICDLLDSTEFKRHHPEMEWLAKTRLHNRVAEECVTNLGGRVIKFQRDGLLAEFEGTEHASRSIEAGLAIIEAVEAQNKRRKYEGAKKLETAIGVASGEVFWFKYEQSNEPDPQGSTVDLAARLCGLAGPQQLICSKVCFEKAGGNDAFPHSSKELERFVQGFDEPVPMRLVLPEGRDCEDIRLVGHRRDTRPENLELLKAARKALKKSEFNDAEKSFRKLVGKEPGNFEANFRLAELLLGRPPGEGQTRPGNIEKAREHLRTARQINPESWRVWFLASVARRSRFENSRDYADLDRAIKHAEEAINKASEFMDADGANQTKLALAEMFLARSRDSEGDGAAYLSRAARLCDEIKNAFNGAQKRRKSDRLVTTAMVQLAQGKTPRKTIKKMLQEAVEIDPNNANVHRALAAFLEGGDADDPETSPVSD